MTWSPLACGIISGKYDGRVPPYSRASLKVGKPPSLVFLSPTMITGVTVNCPLLVEGCLFIVCFCLSGAHLMLVYVLCAVLTPCPVYLFPSNAVCQLVSACHTLSPLLPYAHTCIHTAAIRTFNEVCWLYFSDTQPI